MQNGGKGKGKKRKVSGHRRLGKEGPRPASLAIPSGGEKKGRAGSGRGERKLDDGRNRLVVNEKELQKKKKNVPPSREAVPHRKVLLRPKDPPSATKKKGGRRRLLFTLSFLLLQP